MYSEHFQLSTRPFSGGPDHQFFTANEAVTTAVNRLRQVLTARDNVAVISGGPGVGKTALLEQARAGCGNTAALACADLRQTETDLLYDLLLLSLGAESTGGDQALALHRLHETIGGLNEQGCAVTAVLDLNGLTADRAKRILRLIHSAGQSGAQLNVILQGPHALQKVIDIRGLIHLRQRVSLRHRIRPLTLEETDRYVRHCLTRANADIDAVMAADVPATVYRFVAGVPRLINTMLDASFAEACVRGADQVTGAIVSEVAVQLGWKSLDKSQPSVSVSPARTETTDQGRLGRQPAVQPAAHAQSDVTQKLLATAATQPQAAPSAPQPSAQAPVAPPMNPQDTSATGMLKLEDLDAKFAETVFGEDTGMFAALPLKKEEKAAADS